MSAAFWTVCPHTPSKGEGKSTTGAFLFSASTIQRGGNRYASATPLPRLDDFSHGVRGVRVHGSALREPAFRGVGGTEGREPQVCPGLYLVHALRKRAGAPARHVSGQTTPVRRQHSRQPPRDFPHP